MGAKYRRRVAAGQNSKRLTQVEQTTAELLSAAFERIRRLEIVLNAAIAVTDTQEKIKDHLAAAKAAQEASDAKPEQGNA